MSVTDHIRRHPLSSALLVVVVPAMIGLIAAPQVDAELRKVLYAASVTLIFGGFIGGLLKILLEDFTLSRHRRQDNAGFVTNVLARLQPP